MSLTIHNPTQPHLSSLHKKIKKDIQDNIQQIDF
jgi:hypothetical protein